VRKYVVAAIESAGVPMSRVNVTVYRTRSGSLVAMPFSSEGKQPGTWFFGAYEKNFDEVLLLCETDDEIVCLHLPHDVLRTYLPKLRRDTKGEVKFHVLRQRDRYHLKFPYGPSVPLDRFDPSSQAHLLGGGSDQRT
jgi:hypothetical protein